MAALLHNIELFFRAKANRLIQSSYSPLLIRDAGQQLPKSQFKRILLLRHDRIGDVLISTPFLAELKKLLPEAEIDILLSFRNYSARRAVVHYVNNILIYRNKPLRILKLLHLIRKQKYDLIIDLFDNESVTSNLIMKYSNVPSKLGFDKSNSNNYTHIVPLPDKNQVHIAKRLFSLLIPFGMEQDSASIRLEFPLSSDDIEKANELLGEKKGVSRFGINLSGSSRDKYWGDSNYTDFINEISRQAPIKFILFATEKLKNKALFISSRTKAGIAPVVTDFNLYAAMISKCDYLLTPDTSAVHLAAALNVPLIALYQFSDEKYGMPWFPLSQNSRSITNSVGINKISVDEVVRAFHELSGDRI